MAFVSHKTLDFPQIVGEEFQKFIDLSSFHKDGWGISIIDEGSETVTIKKSPGAARESKEFPRIARELQGNGGLLHLRWATSGLDACDENTHPFVHDGFAFIHNGEIKNRHAIDSYIPDLLFNQRIGDTDSERYFFLLISQIEKYGIEKGAQSALDIIEANSAYSSLNAMLLNSENLLVISKFDPTRIPSGQPTDYYNLAYKKEGEKILIASSGWPQNGWIPIPNNSLLFINRNTQKIDLIALD